MAIYKYNNKETPGYFTDFETIKPSLKRGDKIQFFDGGMKSGHTSTAINYTPGCGIGETTTYDKIKKHLFNLSGFKVKIKLHTYLQQKDLEWFDYWYNVDAELTLDCRNLPKEKGTFFIGLLKRYNQYTLNVKNNELISTGCFNIIPFDETNSLRGLENRRIFVIGNYGKVVQDGYENTYYGYSKGSEYKYGIRQYVDQSTSTKYKLITGGNGWYGGEAHDSHGGYYIPSGGSNFILDSESINKVPSQYMPDYQQYLDIMSNGKITLLSRDDPNRSGLALSFEIIILKKLGEVDTSIMRYYNGTEMIDCSPHYMLDQNNLIQTDAYYFDGKELKKL